MNARLIAAVLLLASGVWTGQALGWASANRAGGSTSHSYGSTSHTNAWGGSSSHTAGEGTSHTDTYGGSTSHAYGGGTEHTNTYGGSTYGAYGSGAYHTYPSGATAYHPPGYPAYPTYPAYHPPVAVPYYSSGCYGCAAAAGAIVGVAAGAAVASANTAAATSNAYAAGVATGSANTAAATAGAYNAGVATGAAMSSAPPASGTYVMGMSYALLPAGSITINKNGATYYLNGNTWFQPAYGANGVYYIRAGALNAHALDGGEHERRQRQKPAYHGVWNSDRCCDHGHPRDPQSADGLSAIA